MTELHYLLPRKCNRYRRTKAAGLRRVLRDNISKKQSIDVRPGAVNNRQEIGYWEGDTIVGKERTARILTHVERKSGYLLATLMTNVSGDRISPKQFKTVMEAINHRPQRYLGHKPLHFCNISSDVECNGYFNFKKSFFLF